MTSPSQAASEAPRPPVLQTLMMLVAIAVVCAAYIALNAVVGSNESYVGFLFLFYWAGLRKADPAAWPASAAGAFVGLGLGLLMQQLGLRLGTPGLLIFVGLMLGMTFLFLRGHLPMFINDSTMLLLLVATVAHVQAHADFQGLFVSLGISVAFFGALFWGIARLKARSGAPAAGRGVRAGLG